MYTFEYWSANYSAECINYGGSISMGYPRWWVLKCFSRVSLLANFLLQHGHSSGFNCRWIDRRCLFKSPGYPMMCGVDIILSLVVWFRWLIQNQLPKSTISLTSLTEAFVAVWAAKWFLFIMEPLMRHQIWMSDITFAYWHDRGKGTFREPMLINLHSIFLLHSNLIRIFSKNTYRKCYNDGALYPYVCGGVWQDHNAEEMTCYTRRT